MEKFIVEGGNPLKGHVKVGGAKNAAMKMLIAGMLTDEKIELDGVPVISSVTGTAEILKSIGVDIQLDKNHVTVDSKNIKKHVVPLDVGSHYRTGTMVIGPLLQRFGRAVVPNPGGCRIGLRPINHHIDAISKMGAKIDYNSEDGFFYAELINKKLHGIEYTFPHNSHTGTETLILAAVLAEGVTVIHNAAAEPEVDDLIELLLQMGADIKRISERKIIIKGVKKLNGTSFKVMPDRNEAVTFAIAAIATGGDVVVEGTEREYLGSFLEKLDEANAGWEAVSDIETRFFKKGDLRSTNVVTMPHPGFMTDWHSPWTILMTQSKGESTVHETIFEDRFSYVKELLKMGSKIDFYTPEIEEWGKLYNFEASKRPQNQAIRITGITQLHDAILKTTDLRAGATLVIAGLVAKGTSHIHGIEHIDRGYERLDERLESIGAKVKRVKE